MIRGHTLYEATLTVITLCMRRPFCGYTLYEATIKELRLTKRFDGGLMPYVLSPP